MAGATQERRLLVVACMPSLGERRLRDDEDCPYRNVTRLKHRPPNND